ncbi:MAG: M56 family metallopeptidase [Bacteroidales bacterium]|jgi:TonB family protein|nr:M56 family metallopeptidase [Bacteroidales bacterium]
MSFDILNIFESAITLALFYLFYKIFLRNETFFKMNRLYLLSSLLFAVTIPFLNINLGGFSNYFSSGDHIFQEILGIKGAYYEINEVIVYAYSGKLTWTTIFKYLSAIYIVGVIISTMFFVFGLGKIIIMIWQNKPKRYGKYRIVETPNAVVPFSLFKWIIINPGKYSSNDMEQIIAHERMHAFQLHSLDLILIEVLVILFWFNPFIYWYRKSIREIHEYLADQAVVENGHDHIDYQKLLLSQVTDNRFIGLTSSFSYSLSKNRLKMLSMIKSKNTSKIKIALAIPFAIVAMFFFVNSVDFAKANGKITNEVTIRSQDTLNNIVKENDELVYFNVEIMPKFLGKESGAFRTFIQKNLKYPEVAQKNGASGRVFVQFDVNKEGDVKNVKVVRGADPDLDKEALRVVNSSPKWEPGINEGEPVIVRYTFPIAFSLK